MTDVNIDFTPADSENAVAYYEPAEGEGITQAPVDVVEVTEINGNTYQVAPTQRLTEPTKDPAEVPWHPTPADHLNALLNSFGVDPKSFVGGEILKQGVLRVRLTDNSARTYRFDPEVAFK